MEGQVSKDGGKACSFGNVIVAQVLLLLLLHACVHAPQFADGRRRWADSRNLKHNRYLQWLNRS
jgi:hypothetical protein